jgi:hypothetical protein
MPAGDEAATVQQLYVEPFAAERGEVDDFGPWCLTVHGHRDQASVRRAEVAQPELVLLVEAHDERVVDEVADDSGGQSWVAQLERLPGQLRSAHEAVPALGEPLQVEAGNRYSPGEAVLFAVAAVEQHDGPVRQPGEIRVVAATGVDHPAVAESLTLVVAH